MEEITSIESVIKNLRHISHDKHMRQTFGDGSMNKASLVLLAADMLEQYKKKLDVTNNRVSYVSGMAEQGFGW